jgi:hypothetical protein
MAEINIDGQKVKEIWIDNNKCKEVWIDNCKIGFEKIKTTGWFRINSGTGDYNFDLTEVDTILAAGIRFRGCPSNTLSLTTSTKDPGTTSTSLDSPPSSARGASSGSLTGYAIRARVGTGGIYVEGYLNNIKIFEGGSSGSGFILSYYSLYNTTSSMSTASIVRTSGTAPYSVQCYTRYNRTFYTTDTRVSIANLGVSQEYFFGNGNLTNGSIATGPLQHPITGDLYGEFQPLYFAAGYNNTINFYKMNFNSRSVHIDVDIFLIYEGNMPGDDD